MGKSKNIWRNYYIYCESSYCMRGGTIACGVLPRLKGFEDPSSYYDKKPEFVSEHMGRSAFLLGQILMNYPDLTDKDTWFSQMMFLLCHDAGEYKNGDLLDDGSLKDSDEFLRAKDEEMETLDEMFCNFPSRYSMEMCNMLPKFEEYSGTHELLDKMVEKLDAVLFQLFLYSRGVVGNVKWKKPYPSGRDLRFADIVGSPRAVDVWTLHYRIATKHAPKEYQEPLFKILKAAFSEVYPDVPRCIIVDVSNVLLDAPSDKEYEKAMRKKYEK